MALITAAQILTLVSSRNLDEGHILASEITACELDYVRDAIGQDLYDAVVTNSGGAYDDFITDYIHPVLAYGVLSNIWQRLGVEVTDRGINSFTGEGITTPQVQDKENTLFEIRQRLSTFQKAMIDYASTEYEDLFDTDLNYVTDEISYHSERTKRYNQL